MQRRGRDGNGFAMLVYMKTTLLLTVLSIGTALAQAQNLRFNIHAGTSNYVGELFFKKSKLPEYDLKNARHALGVGIEYTLTSKLSLRGTLTYGKIGADDKKTGIDPSRNLNFTSPIWDLMIGGQYYLLNPERYLISPYVFTGVAFFHFNPYTYDRNNNKVYLQPLSTEGQGFYGGRQPYKRLQVAIPYGAGIKLSLNENVRMGVELSLRKTFTDYLDDVSTTYVDPELLFIHRGQRSVEMAYRGDEAGVHSGYPAAGAERGIPRFNDRYYFTTVSFSFRLNGNGGGKGKGVGCPTRM